ncbi:MAG TPA: VWA domain-containing protein [Pirellulaceae bacterium]|nr:VWA domain-containing protein [Pirellulaceae bacterium]HMO93743.1 VWA domain-containing protein [Pirellulaceae bacterium]HMP69920.1 VWA domain-containing protein [Pirellulaceae bacterium]
MKTSLCLFLICFAICSFASQTSLAQLGMSSMSVGMMRAGLFPSADSIRVSEFINYHEHLLPHPSDGQRLSLDLKQLTHEGKHYVQIGLATPRTFDQGNAQPLNLVLVIDTSGSMAVGNRIERVRHGLSMMVERLRANDRVTLVTFSSSAEVLLPACGKTDQARIQTAINSLRPTSSTNLHGGLMLGYQMALENFCPRRSNRVILLTDGIANVGQTDPKAIAAESALYNQRGIDLSTIGVGDDLNHNLLRELASAGRGAVHFVDDREDLTKCFITEIESLLIPAVRNLKLTVDGFDKKSKPRVFGYEPQLKSYQFELPLENMSQGATQVVLLEFSGKSLPESLDVKLNFSDAMSSTDKTLCQQLDISAKQVSIATERNTRSTTGDVECEDFLGDFPKNLAIAFVAQALADAAKTAEQDDEAAGRKILKLGLRKAKSIYANPQDADLVRITQIANNIIKQ